MTKEELIKDNFKEVDNKLKGKIYVKGYFFCSFNDDGSVDVRNAAFDDTKSLGTANSIKEIKLIQLKYYKNLRDSYYKKAEELNTYIQLIEDSLK